MFKFRCAAVSNHPEPAAPVNPPRPPPESRRRRRLVGGDVGYRQNVILPGSFTGGPRCMQGLYHDAMAVVRKYGKPDLFLTFTCNPKWKEIQEAVCEGQTAADRPDIVARLVLCGVCVGTTHSAVVDDMYRAELLTSIEIDALTAGSSS